MGSGVGGHGVFSALPYARCQVEATLRVGNAIPIQNQLEACEQLIRWQQRKVRTPPFLMASSCANLSASYNAVKRADEWSCFEKKCAWKDAQIPSLPVFLLLRKTTQYHSLSSSSGSLSSDQLNASSYGTLAYSGVTERKL